MFVVKALIVVGGTLLFSLWYLRAQWKRDKEKRDAE